MSEDKDNGSPPSQYLDNSDSVILDLARQITNISTHSSKSNSPSSDLNPFIDFSNSLLNPQSPDFSHRAWAKHFLNLQAQDPERYPHRHAGVSFKHLGAYGHGTGYDYQKTVLNVIESSFQYLKSLGKKKTKIQILHDFNGIVKPGETCVVLGRPGR